MRPTEPPGPAGAVSISCVGSPPGTARLLEVGELEKDWVVGGQAAPLPPRARTQAHCELGLRYPDTPPLGWIWGLHLWCRWKSLPQELLELRKGV